MAGLMSKNFKAILTTLIAIPIGLAVLGFGVGTIVDMPAYANVYVDDASHIYLAPQCAPAWQHRDGFAVLRRTSAGEALGLHYKQDDACNETGAFHPDGYPLTLLILSKTGLLPPKRQWWDRPYRTEQGIVHPPATTPQPR